MVQKCSGILLWYTGGLQDPGCRSWQWSGDSLSMIAVAPLPIRLLIKILLCQKSAFSSSLQGWKTQASPSMHAYFWRMFKECGTGHHPWGLALGFPNTQSSISKTALLCIAEHSTKKSPVGALFSFVQIFLNTQFLRTIEIIRVDCENKKAKYSDAFTKISLCNHRQLF